MKNLYILLISLLVLCSCAETGEKNTKNDQKTDEQWWKEAIVYQIYPRSFKDTDGDGVGDLKGITEKLDYIKSLGVTAVWLNPIYSSPNDDNGYDVSNYEEIIADFGTMQDFDTMLQGMHAHGLKLVMDMVINHSSDEHEWFKQSRSSRDNPYRDYYHWWPAEKGKPPYRYSLFDEKGNAWKYDSVTNAYYLHYFSEKQPDLNWENPKVRDKIYAMMRFWADKGVDGFRLDAFQFAAKDTAFPEFPKGYEKNFIQYYAMQDGLHTYLKEMNDEVFSKYDVMSVAEGAGRNFQDAHNLVDADRHELNMAYPFDGVDIPKRKGYSLVEFKKVYTKWDSAFAKKGWLSIFLSNHDQARMVSRYASDSLPYRAPSAKMLNTFILSMRGTPYCYYGDELGMTNIGFDSISQYKDIAAINGYRKAQFEGRDTKEYLKDLKFSSRDNGRTPMQWDGSKNSGFSNGNSWLPVNANYLILNVSDEENDPNSVLNHFKKMTQLRADNKALIYGDYTLLAADNRDIYAYTRRLGNERFLIILNFSKNKSEIKLPEIAQSGKIMINNYPDFEQMDSTAILLPFQGVIIRQ